MDHIVTDILEFIFLMWFAIFSAGTLDVLINIGIIILKIAAVVAVVMTHVAYATYFERKAIGHMQVRLGPMRVGPHGILQPIADFVKLFFKEDIIPAQADKPLFYIAPVIAVFAAMSSLAVIPFFNGFVIANLNIGLLFILAMSSIGAYGIIMAGWSSNSKYSFLGGLRSSAQVISYEIAMGLSLVGVVMMAGSLNLTDIVKAQQAYPLKMYIFPQFLGFFVFMVAAFAETNRTPFDLPEAESELVAGYFVEYSGMRFALFFAAEYIGMILMALLGAICYLGGWNGPFQIPYIPFAWLLVKVYCIVFLFYWVRATVPRYRYDQLMALGWKIMIPLTLLNIVITGVIKILT
ncbi:MAG: NADH-quinone oxidoreductase subunit NuoH [Thermodesulfovibrionales bacterium]|nr:NADH-quinone oxidoreductase subunit NuoH [Thermodesulfovibrionales bacterium]